MAHAFHSLSQAMLDLPFEDHHNGLSSSTWSTMRPVRVRRKLKQPVSGIAAPPAELM
jgi:hypothetical protein